MELSVACFPVHLVLFPCSCRCVNLFLSLCVPCFLLFYFPVPVVMFICSCCCFISLFLSCVLVLVVVFPCSCHLSWIDLISVVLSHAFGSTTSSPAWHHVSSFTFINILLGVSYVWKTHFADWLWRASISNAINFSLKNPKKNIWF